MSEYAEFLQRKVDYGSRHGFDPLFMPDFLFDFQRAIVDWAVKLGRAAIFADCGMGKTPMQLDASLNADAATGQYVWSAAAHRPPPVRSGTLCDADVIIAEKRPLDQFAPAMRRWLGIG